MQKDSKFKAAVIQMNSGDMKEKNIVKADELLSIAVEKGANFILLPENFSYMGRKEGDKLSAAETKSSGKSIDFLSAFARDHKVWIGGGSIPLKTPSASKVTNSLLIFNNYGKLISRYDKIHLFDVAISNKETYLESKVIEAGKNPVVAGAPFGCLGLSICYDLRFPELYRKLVKMGAEIFLLPSAFTYTTGKAHWEVLLRSRAIENQVYVMAAAQVGTHPGDRRTFGHSMIIDPWGKILSQVEDKEGVAVAEIDIDLVYEIRKKLPCLAQRQLY